ncbi:primase-like DNA-binding domain-containing protein [Nitrosococcus wardiae]|uniref:Uncharacterized protein n=1 Tax=Nitrosococcus wardiae TaxID=1814290 RepID=A0A4P7C5K6_9GAMM|nr:primase-like DNA-binding domain-containing protein [Nitrosococcus wardiae]QBQ56296.1 hypothetical protein E3U44_18690 [Nitrosococcus wardiae]
MPFERVVAHTLTEEEKEEWEKRGGEAQLHVEIPGLIGWLLDMPIEEMEHAIAHPPSSVIGANIEAMRDSNPVADWVMENCIPSRGEWTRVGIKQEVKDMGGVHYRMEGSYLYPNYLQWCRQNGREPLSIRRFRAKVEDMLKNCLRVDVISLRREEGIGIQGIRLRKPEEPVYDWLNFSQM